MTIRRLILLLVVLAGCGGVLGTGYPLASYVDPAMPSAERWAIAEAERAWLDAGADARDVAAVRWFWGALPPGICGRATPRLAVITLAHNRCRGHLAVVAAHELGHVLTGPEHSPRPADVMFWRVNDEQTTLTDHDMARLK